VGMDILLDLVIVVLLVTSPLLDLISALLVMIHFVTIARFPFLVTPLLIGKFTCLFLLLCC
jgi:hypothetical protein